MAWSEELPNGRWRACWRDTQGRKRSKSGFTKSTAAKNYGAEQEGRSSRGEITYSGRSMTWGQWCPQWLAIRSVEASSADAERWRIPRWVEPRWGSVPLNRIVRRDIQAWIGELSLRLGPASVGKVYRILSASMRAAVEHDVIAVNPCTGVKLPKTLPGTERYMTRPEIESIAHYLNDPYKAAVLLLAGTGLRFGEMAGLHWHRVDLEAEAIDVVETWDDTAGRVKGYPKSGRTRRVPLPSWVQDAIGMPSLAKSCGLPHVGGSRCRSGLVVPALGGGALSARNMRNRHWTHALGRAGIEHARLHDLRHSYASMLIQGGATLQEVAQVMGHSSITVTMRYAHLAPSHADRVRAVLEGD